MASNFSKIYNGVSLSAILIADPSDGVNGDFYYNGSTNRLRIFQNGAWEDLITANDTQTLTNKTLTSPTINTPTTDVTTLIEQASTPSTPSSGNLALYAKTDNSLYIKTPAGTEISVTPNSVQLCKAWVNFNGVTLAGTYTQSGTAVSVTMTAHGMSVGTVFYATITSGTAVTGTYTVLTSTTNAFTYTAGTSLTTSGAIDRITYIMASYNVSSVQAVANSTQFQINFTSNMNDNNYVWSGFAYLAGTSLSPVEDANKNPSRTVSGFWIEIGASGQPTIAGVMVFGN